ncbi:MAG: hypothetical protein GXY33_20875 [Phycisphaerae bacterium]|nr:hypothetical protein [Phycisphaerae bacterium]
MFRNAISRTLAAVFVCGLVTGCQSVHQLGHKPARGYHDLSRVQLQFYAPPGAYVQIGQRSEQVSTYGDGEHRLELTPEQFAIFNLKPGKHEFKYDAMGWEGVSLYGQIEIPSVCGLFDPMTKTMLDRTFIPIALPGPRTLDVLSPLDDRFPYQSTAHRLRISYSEVERLALGDMVTKVVFVADLAKVEAMRDAIQIELVEMEGKRQRMLALINEARLDWIDDPDSKEFIRRQTKLARMDQEIVDLQEQRVRLEALLRADTVLTRRGMLVLATDEILPPHQDPVAMAEELGTVVMVMRIGGRHMHWGIAPMEPAVFVP